MTGACRATIISTRNRLVRAGRIPPPLGTQLKGLVEYPIRPDVEAERKERLTIIKDKTRYTLQDMEMVLTDLLKTTTQARDAAVLARVIGVLKSQMGEKRDLGPNPPLNEEERYIRVLTILRAIGPAEAKRAYEQAYGEATAVGSPSPLRDGPGTEAS